MSNEIDKTKLIQKLIDQKLTFIELTGILKTLGIDFTADEIQKFPGAPPRQSSSRYFSSPLDVKYDYRRPSKNQRAKEVLEDHPFEEDTPETFKKLFTPEHEELIAKEKVERQERQQRREQQKSSTKKTYEDKKYKEKKTFEKEEDVPHKKEESLKSGRLPKNDGTGPTWKNLKEAVDKGRQETIKEILFTDGNPIDLVKQLGTSIKAALGNLAVTFTERSDALATNIKDSGATVSDILDEIYQTLQKQSLMHTQGGVPHEDFEPEDSPTENQEDHHSILKDITGGLWNVVKNLAETLATGAAFRLALKIASRLVPWAAVALLGYEVWQHKSEDSLKNIQDHQKAAEEQHAKLWDWIHGLEHQQQDNALQNMQQHQKDQNEHPFSLWDWATGLFTGEHKSETTTLGADQTITIETDELTFKKKNSDDSPDFDVNREHKGDKLSGPTDNEKVQQRFAEGGVSKGGVAQVSPGEQIHTKSGANMVVPGVPNKQDNISMNLPAGSVVGPYAGALSSSQYDANWMLAKHNAAVLQPGIRGQASSADQISNALKNNPQWGIKEGSIWGGGPAGNIPSTNIQRYSDLKEQEKSMEDVGKLVGGNKESGPKDYYDESHKRSQNEYFIDHQGPSTNPGVFPISYKTQVGSSGRQLNPSISQSRFAEGETRTGKGSYYSSIPGRADWPVDKGDMDKHGNPLPSSSGRDIGRPGIALPYPAEHNPSLGALYQVTAPSGQTISGVPQIDTGPGARTGRLTDINAALADQFGYQDERKGATNPFPTDSNFKLRRMTEEESSSYRDAAFAGPPEMTTATSSITPPRGYYGGGDESSTQDITQANNEEKNVQTSQLQSTDQSPDVPDPPENTSKDVTGTVNNDTMPNNASYNATPNGDSQGVIDRTPAKQDSGYMPTHKEYSDVE